MLYIDKFRDQLITAIASSPIVYIPHFDYGYIDSVISDIIEPSKGVRNILGFSGLCDIIEYNPSIGFVDFITKTKCPQMKNKEISIEGVLKGFIDNDFPVCDGVSFEDEPILLLKNIFQELNDYQIQALLQQYANTYNQGYCNELKTIIIVSPQPVDMLPLELEKLVTIVELNAPSEKDISKLFEEQKIQVSKQYKGQEDVLKIEFIRAMQGLQLYEIQQIIRSSLIRTGGKVTQTTIRLALEEKKQLVKKSGIIEVIDSDISLDQVGGLDVLKEEVRQKAKIYQNLTKAQEFKLSLPKGVLIIGMPGCGKSLIAKSIANEFGVTLLRLDVNRLMGQYVGQSESNLRRALATAESAHPCVLWIDEIEKAFAGSTGKDNDTLVMRLMGHFLTWMQERKTPVYIVATANNVMRPEFMRKGRFDEIYFVDFPNEIERKEILINKLKRFRTNEYLDFTQFDNSIDAIVDSMTGKLGGFSGAEIESVVNLVMENKFLDYLSKTNEDDKRKIVVKVEKKDFDKVISSIKDAVLSNQEGEKDVNGNKQPTDVERIKELQKVYKFKLASKKS